MSKAKQEQARRRSILLAALAHAAGKRVDRSLIAHETRYPVSATIAGTVGRAGCKIFLEGELDVGAPSSGSSARSAPTVDVVASLLEDFPSDEARAKAIDRITTLHVRHGKLTPSESMKKKAKAFCSTLRTHTVSRKAAPMSFYVKDES